MSEKAAPRRLRAAGKHRVARPRVGLALAGGGPLGGIYEVGALLALAESLDGVDFNEFDARDLAYMLDQLGRWLYRTRPPPRRARAAAAAR